MKIVSYLIALALVFSFIACDDNLNTVGSSIQPGGDNILVETDTFVVKTKTVALDSIYAWSTSGLLGKYLDDVMGTVKSDYLTEFYSPNPVFNGRDIVIDSVQLGINFIYYSGDKSAPMGLSVYKVTSPLTNNFYTNVDPAKYCDMQHLLGQQTYSIDQADSYTSDGVVIRTLVTNLDKGLGQKFYKDFASSDNPFANSEKFKKYFPGIYVTTTFGSGSLIEAENTVLNIYYNYKKDNHNQTADTTIVDIFSLMSTSDIIQLNHVANTIPQDLLAEDAKALYVKSPAGVCLEIEFPILEIMNKLGDDKNKSINSAKFSLLGNTELEDKLISKFAKPNKLLLIERDSVENFFRKKKSIDYATNAIIQRNAATNTYDMGNVALIIREYKNRKDLKKNPKFLLFPVNDVLKTNAVTGAVERSIYHYMKPLNAVIRNDEQYMKMGLIFSKY